MVKLLSITYSDAQISGLQPLEPFPFNVSKLPLLSGETLIQILKLAGLTGEVIFHMSSFIFKFESNSSFHHCALHILLTFSFDSWCFRKMK